MAKNFDLTSPQWLDMVFKGKNKEYGAYVMRSSSSNRHLLAMAITALLVSGGMFLPGLFKANASATTVEPLGIKSTVMLTTVEKNDPEENVIEKPIETPPPPVLKPTIQFTPPVIARDTEVEEKDLMAMQVELSNTDLTISILTNLEGASDGVDPADLADNRRVVDTPAKPKEPFKFVEQMPQFPGGNDALMKWLSSNLVYPAIAAETGKQGTVTLRFVVTETGSIGEVQILRGVDRDLDKEAIRVVGKLPNFIPGRQNGQAVPVWFTLPVKFKLQ